MGKCPEYWLFQEYFQLQVCSVTKSCSTLSNSMDCSPPGSSAHGISQTRILEWVAISYYKGSSWPMFPIQVSYIAGWFFTNWSTREAPLCVYKIFFFFFSYVLERLFEWLYTSRLIAFFFQYIKYVTPPFSHIVSDEYAVILIFVSSHIISSLSLAAFKDFCHH